MERVAAGCHCNEAERFEFRDLPQHGRREIVSLGETTQQGDGDNTAEGFLEIVVRAACQADSLSVTVPRISSDEIAWSRLEAMGFQKGRTYTRYAEFPGSRMH